MADHLHDRGTYFAARRLPFIAVDVRGRGNSQGQFRPFKGDGKDGHDVVEWVAAQPYCNGKIGMYGGSYLGHVQWVTVAQFPQHLVTIAPTAAPFLGVDVPMRGNIFQAYQFRWLSGVDGSLWRQKMFADVGFWIDVFRRLYESGVPFREADDAVGTPLEVFQEWLRHPELDAYWDSMNPSDDQYAKCRLPVLTVTGIYDGNQLGALEHYRRHMRSSSPEARAQHYLVIGPWNHAGCGIPVGEFDGIKVGAESVIDMYGLHYEWYSWLMQHGPKPALLKDKVAYYVMGAERWRYAATLDLVTERFVALYLDAATNPVDALRSGCLSLERPQDAAPAEYVYDPRDVSIAALESTVEETCLTEQRVIHASVGKILVYHSVPFERDTEISGFFKLAAWISIDQPDTDFRVRVYEIDLQGGSILLTSDCLRARYRASLREACLVSTHEPLLYSFERFTFVSRMIRKDHRLRLVIDSNNSIYEHRNYNCGGVVSAESQQESRRVTVRLFQDTVYPSVLSVPIGCEETSGSRGHEHP
jgi:putative CocE/NonD family hydrolase